MSWIDLTMTVLHNMPVYPHDPPMELVQTASLLDDGFCNSVLKTGMHVGTHIDGPLHMMANGQTIDNIDLDFFTGEALVIDARETQVVALTHYIQQLDMKKKIVLICTGFSKNFGNENYFTSHPVLSNELAEYFVAQNVKMVGMDIPSPDREPFDVHRCLLSNDIFIIENLTNLEELLDKKNIELFAFPLKTRTDSAPARVAARI